MYKRYNLQIILMSNTYIIHINKCNKRWLKIHLVELKNVKIVWTPTLLLGG